MPRRKKGNTFSILEDAVTLALDQKSDQPKTEQKDATLKYPLAWIDLEMTGLDVETDTILQIAVIITDGNLKQRVEGPELAIHHSDDVLNNMNEWCIKTHAESGLTQAVKDSTTTMAEAEHTILDFIKKHVPEVGVAQLAGNSVHVDLAFLKKKMPSIPEYLSYRIVDVSSVGELCRRWYPRDYGKGPSKSNAHTAMSDIRESIEQLKYYQKTIFKQKADAKSK